MNTVPDKIVVWFTSSVWNLLGRNTNVPRRKSLKREEKKPVELLSGYVCDTFQKRFVNSNRLEKAHIIVINPVINTCKKVLTCTSCNHVKSRGPFCLTRHFELLVFRKINGVKKSLVSVRDKRFNLFFQPTCIWPLWRQVLISNKIKLNPFLPEMTR